MNSYDWLLNDSDTIIEKGEEKPFSIHVDVKDYYKPVDPIWTTATGQKIPISKMDTRHICNCIKLLASRGMFRDKWFTIFKEELKRRKTGKLETSFSL